MLKLLMTMSIIVSITNSFLDVYYRFGSNTGQIFHDFEPNNGNLDAVNGNTHMDTNFDTSPSDRGAFFSTTQFSTINLPSNSKEPNKIILSSTFSLAIWILPSCFSQAQILFRKVSPGSFFSLTTDGQGKLNMIFFGSNVLGTSNEFLNSYWCFVTIKIDSGNRLIYSINGNIQGTINLGSPYDESTSTAPAMHLGNSFNGFIWEFKIFTDNIIDSNYFSGSYSPGYCLTPSCPTSCHISIINNNIQYCISNDADVTHSSQVSDCPATCYYGCLDSLCLYCPCDFFTCEVNPTQFLSMYCPNSKVDSKVICADGFFYDEIGCAKCNTQCKTCKDFSSCITCIDPNSVPDVTNCKCNKGYYSSVLPNTPVFCFPCQTGCETCSTSMNCNSCLTGFYQPLYSMAGFQCKRCNIQCKTCDNPNTCIDCIDSLMQTSATSGCECKSGYYLVSNNCISCPSDCLGCSSLGDCIDCIVQYAHPNGQACDCPINSIRSQACTCDKGYFMEFSLITKEYICSPCGLGCKICENYSKCLICNDNNATPYDSSCVCANGFFQSPDITTIKCNPCFFQCSSCIEPLKCVTCKAANAVASPTKGCDCEIGYTASTNPPNKCIKCHRDCYQCYQNLTCSSCIDPNAVPEYSGCRCLDGYFRSNSSIPQFTCKSCQSQCLTCIDGLTCLTCKDQLMKPSDKFICECIDGYYENSGVCFKCPDDCYTCADFFTCKSCQVINSNPNGHSGCDCPLNSSLINSICICYPGFYNDLGLNGNVCSPCISPCLSCVNQTYCLSCINNLKLSVNNTCDACLGSMYLKDNACWPCPLLCESCDEMECKKCVKHASYTGKCDCDLGYYINEGYCKRKMFTAKVNVLKNDSIVVRFDEAVNSELNRTNFQLKIENFEGYWHEVFRRNTAEYLIVVRFSLNVERKYNAILQVSADYEIVSVKNSLYLNISHSLKLNQNIGYPLNHLTTQLLNQTKTATRIAVASALTSFFINNPSNAWILLNNVQLLSYIPLGSTPLTPALRALFKSFAINEIIQNPLIMPIAESLFNLPKGSEPYKLAKVYGFQTDSFIINSGTYIISLIIVLSLAPIIWAGSKIKSKKISEFALKIMKNYKYSFFLRFYLQGYMDLTIFALVQMVSVRLIKVPKEWFSGMGLGISIVIMVISALFPIGIIVICYRNFSLIKQDEENFARKWGSLFEEFKNNDNYLSSLFYAIYCIRRLLFALSQVFLNELFQTQDIINALFSLIQVAYLCSFMPYRSKSALLNSFSMEICVLIVNLLVCFISFLNQDDLKMLEIAEIVIIFSVYLNISIQVTINLILLIQYTFKKLRILFKVLTHRKPNLETSNNTRANTQNNAKVYSIIS